MTPKSAPTDAEIALVRGCVIYEDDQVIALNKPADFIGVASAAELDITPR